MALALHPPHERVILHGVTWATFARLFADRGDSAGVRLASDRGTGERTMPSPAHAWFTATLTHMVDAMACARDLHDAHLASTTCTREDRSRGFAPDAGFSVQHADAMHELRRLDLTIDPPPDVVLESDITSTALHTLPLYAALGVPEVWRSPRQGIHLYQRRGEGDEPIESSTVFPGVHRTDLDHFLEHSRAMTNRTAWCKAVVAWVQAHDAPRPTPYASRSSKRSGDRRLGVALQ